MPEGDTVHKVANFLAPRLRKQKLLQVDMRDRSAASRCVGCRIDRVRARGKHLFIDLDNDTTLRSHLGMYGSWHRYAPGEAWRKPRSRASLVLVTADNEYVCFNAKEVELLNAASVRARIVDARLGPDLIADAVDFDRIVLRAREFCGDDALIADALLDQRVAAGIGNVFKSEILFLERILPDTRLVAVTDAAVARCFETAAGLLRANLGGGRRVTRFEDDDAGRLWVYGREGLPCLRCADGIVGARLGRHHRPTCWCPTCQSGKCIDGLPEPARDGTA